MGKYECEICHKKCNSIRVDIDLPKDERFWKCEKCYFMRIKKQNASKNIKNKIRL